MTIRTAQAYTVLYDGYLFRITSGADLGDMIPVTIVEATESEVLAAFAALERSRDVCEYTSGDFGSADVYYPVHHERDQIPTFEIPKFCPSCGLKVVVK